MQIVGIIGGIGPESTGKYYRWTIAEYRSEADDENYPPLRINSIDMKKMLDLIGGGDLAGTTAFLAAEVGRLAAAGADFAALTSNAPHIVFPELQRVSAIPLISIVEAAACEAARLGLKRLGLMGTRIAMESDFYLQIISRDGMELSGRIQRIGSVFMRSIWASWFSGKVFPKHARG